MALRCILLTAAALTGGCGDDPPAQAEAPSSSSLPHVFAEPAEDAAPDTVLPFFGVKERIRLGRGIWPDRVTRRYDLDTIGEPDRGASGSVLHWDELGLHVAMKPPYIDRIGITSPRWRTREDIGIGTSFAEVMRVYGEDYEEEVAASGHPLLGFDRGEPRAGIRYPWLGLTFYSSGPVLTRGHDVAAMEMDRDGNAFDAYDVVDTARLAYDSYGGPLTMHGIRPGVRVARLRERGMDVPDGDRVSVDTELGRCRLEVRRGRVVEIRGGSLEQNGVALVALGDTVLSAWYVLGYENARHDYPDRSKAARFDGSIGAAFVRDDQHANVSLRVEAGRVTGVTLSDLDLR
jgi:hypothetical protein